MVKKVGIEAAKKLLQQIGLPKEIVDKIFEKIGVASSYMTDEELVEQIMEEMGWNEILEKG